MKRPNKTISIIGNASWVLFAAFVIFLSASDLKSAIYRIGLIVSAYAGVFVIAALTHRVTRAIRKRNYTVSDAICIGKYAVCIAGIIIFVVYQGLFVLAVAALMSFGGPN